MKLPCTLTILDRNTPANAKKSNRPINSTIAICNLPNRPEKHCLLVFNSKNPTGTKYEVNGNIHRVITKYIKDGKVTIQFKNPPHDFYIQANVILMKSFVNTLHKIVTGFCRHQDTKAQSLSVAVTNKFVIPTKLVIRSKSEYSRNRLPLSLESLTVEVPGLECFDDALRLINLKVLNLSDNDITFIPKEFSRMHNLRMLDLSKNYLHVLQPEDWKWLSGNLCITLVSLNIASNGLKFLSKYVIKLKNLHSLDVSDNKLKELPNGIGCLRKLKNLKINNNAIERLPGSIRCLQLAELDVSNNNFPRARRVSLPNPPLVSVMLENSLKELAAGKVLELGLKYNPSIIPATLVKYLDFEAKYCVCGKPCFKCIPYKYNHFCLHNVADSVITDPYTGSAAAVDCYLCSTKCARIYIPNRMPLVR